MANTEGGWRQEKTRDASLQFPGQDPWFPKREWGSSGFYCNCGTCTPLLPASFTVADATGTVREFFKSIKQVKYTPHFPLVLIITSLPFLFLFPFPLFPLPFTPPPLATVAFPAVLWDGRSSRATSVCPYRNAWGWAQLRIGTGQQRRWVPYLHSCSWGTKQGGGNYSSIMLLPLSPSPIESNPHASHLGQAKVVQMLLLSTGQQGKQQQWWRKEVAVTLSTKGKMEEGLIFFSVFKNSLETAASRQSKKVCAAAPLHSPPPPPPIRSSQFHMPFYVLARHQDPALIIRNKSFSLSLAQWIMNNCLHIATPSTRIVKTAIA